MATPASAAAGFGFDRLAGNDRYETSAAISARFRAVTGAPALTNVILASGESGRTPDALAASFLAGVRNAPVLVTRRDTTPEPILAELRALRTAGATTLTVVGGTAAISDSQIASLRALGFTVDRLGGVDRYATARLVVNAGEGATASNVGLVASGVTTIDALAGGPLAYKGKHPMFLVTRTGIPASTLAAMREAGVTSVYILGGEAAVGPNVVAQLASAGVTVTGRLAGADRSETSVRIAEALIANFGFTNTTFNLASGANEGIDALSGAALSGRENRAILVTNTANSAAPVVAFATRNAATLTAVGHIFGGEAAVTAALQAQITTAGGGSATGGAVTLTSSTVVQGGTLTGTIAGTDVASVSVTGCGLTNQTLGADDNTATAGRQFTLNLPASQAPGSCSLVFTITNNAGTQTSQTVPFTVNAPAQSAPVTAGPELTAVAVTAATSPTNPSVGVVTYTFDEDVTGRGADPSLFHLYRFDGTQFTAGAVRISGSTVVAEFDASQLQNITLGTVDNGAVADVSGQLNPEGAAPVQSVTQAAGITSAPDLVSVGGFRTNIAGDVTVDFVFDEAVNSGLTANAAGFELVLGDGTFVEGQEATTSGDRRTVTVRFAQNSTQLPQSQVARGVVQAGTVGDATAGGGAPIAGNPNALQAADVNFSGNTSEPDLVSARALTSTTVEYTFDQPVSSSAAELDETLFTIYDADANPTPATSVARSQTSATVVTATFASAATVQRAVGASVDATAVRASENTNQAGAVGFNERDEVALQQVAFQSGRTTLPDLLSVRVLVDPVSQNRVVRYTFDQAIVAADVASVDLALYDANNTRFAGTGGTITGTSGDANSIDVAGAFTTAQVNAAVLGTVNDVAGGVTPDFPEYDAPVTR